jgi:hypothetical protein
MIRVLGPLGLGETRLGEKLLPVGMAAPGEPDPPLSTSTHIGWHSSTGAATLISQLANEKIRH